MQAHGANPAQSMAALLGTASAGSVNTGFAEQFAAALQSTGETSPFAQAISDGSINLYAVTNIDPTHVASSTALEQAAKAATGESVDLPSEVTAQLPAEGYQLVKVTPENFAALFGNTESAAQAGAAVQAQIASETPAAQFLIIQTPEGSAKTGVHLLPVAELEALITPELIAAQSTTSASTATNGVTTTTQASSSTATVSAAATGPAANAIPATIETGTTPADAQAAKTVVDAQQTTAANKTAAATSEVGKTLAESTSDAAATKSAKDQPAATSIKALKAAEAETHGVQTQAVSSTAKKSTAAGNSATTQGQTNTATSSSTTQTSANSQSGNEQTGEQKHNNPDDHRGAPNLARSTSANNAPQPANAQPAPVSWTPERLSGIGEGFSADTFAGGLSGLRGESNFLTSMGILGGKASPHMGGQIAKQLNLQVTNAVKNGANEFTMRLDPAELGRVQVKMQFGADGKVAAQVMVERPETLSLLQREVRGLERAIESGGHQAENGGISFSLDTSDGESAGKAFAEAMHQDRLKEQLGQTDADGNAANGEEAFADTEQTDSAILEEILSRVTSETGLDVRV